MAVKEERIELAQANSIAVEGENESKAKISQSNAKRREIEAEAERLATVAEKIAAAKAKEEAYKAEQQAEIERAKKEKSTLEADVITKALIEKQKIELEAEAEAEKQRRQAQGEADALLAMKEAEARGTLEVLSKQAEGFKKIIEAAGGDTNEAVKMMLSDKMEQLVALQVEAIKNIKIDKVTVWDSMNNGNGGSTTANFMSSMMRLCHRSTICSSSTTWSCPSISEKSRTARKIPPRKKRRLLKKTNPKPKLKQKNAPLKGAFFV